MAGKHHSSSNLCQFIAFNVHAAIVPVLMPFSAAFPDVTEEAARRAQSLADRAYSMSKPGNVWSRKV